MTCSPALARTLGPGAICLCLTATLVAAETSQEDRGDFSSASRVLEALERNHGTPVQVLTLLIYPTAADVEVRDPDEPSHVDRFSWEDGTLGDPTPVQVGRSRRRLEARLFILGSEQLAVLPRLLSEAKEAVGTEDAQVTHVILERSEQSSDSGTHWSAPRYRVYVEGPRGGGYAEFGLRGKRGRVVRW